MRRLMKMSEAWCGKMNDGRTDVWWKMRRRLSAAYHAFYKLLAMTLSFAR